MLKRLILLILGLFAAQPVLAADWLRAESEHYVVHAQMSEDELRDLVQLMEHFDRVLKQVVPPQTERARKVEFFLQDRPSRIMRISGVRNEGLDVDLPEISASFATLDKSRRSIHWYRSIFSDQASFYIRNAFWRPNPPWVEDGFGGFFSTTYISDDGAFVVGAPEILSPYEGTVSSAKLMEMMTTGRAPTSVKANSQFRRLNQQAITSLMLEPEYAGLLNRYLDEYSSGTSMEEATAIFGDLNALARKIALRRSNPESYFRQILPDDRSPASIELRPMSKDEVALIVPRFERLYEKDIEATSRKLQRLTERHSESALVWYEYAAAEFERVRAAQFGGNPIFRGFGFSNGELIVSATPYSDEQAWRAVNRALELDPAYAPAITLKAEILLFRLVHSIDPGDDEEFDSVRAMLRPLASEPEANPHAAAVFFQSFIEQGIEPDQATVDLLGRAFVANPAVEEFRYAYAVALVRAGNRDVAQELLTSMLNDPDYQDAAQRVLDQELN